MRDRRMAAEPHVREREVVIWGRSSTLAAAANR
jgi:hypothetical protein